jgi:potassium efflux system protein
VGDAIQMGEASGVVKRIGIRASIVRMGNGSDIIVPNGKLISDNVINWSLSVPRREVDIPVSVPRSAEPPRVIDLLRAAAEEQIAVK